MKQTSILVRDISLALLLLVIIFALNVTPVFAESGKIQNQTHPPLTLSPDKSEIIRLDRSAARVILGNDSHLNIFIDAPNRIVLVPRSPGATHFTVLSENGDVIMERHAIVASPKENYIRIRRSCSMSSDDNCQETQVYFCPDLCHAIAPPREETESAQTEMTVSKNGSTNQGYDKQPLP